MQRITVAVLAVLAIWGALFGWQYLAVPGYAENGAMAHHFSGSPVSFYMHMFFAPLALLLGGFLVVGRVWHNRAVSVPLSYLYIVSSLLAAAGSVELALNTKGNLAVMVGLLVLFALWAYVTVRFALFIRLGNWIEARRLFIRSFAMALASPVTRLLLMAYFLMPIGDFQTAYAWITWLGWLPNVFIAEWWIRRRGAVL